MNRCHFFIEYQWQRCDDLQIPTVFFERGFCEKNNSGSIKFKITGLLEYHDNFFVIFPKGMVIPNQEEEKVLVTQLLLKTLLKYSSNNFIDDEESTWMGTSDTSRVIEIVVWLIEDYKQNGLIHSNIRKEQLNGNGRIEWSKSIQKISPTLIKNKLYYLDLITTKNDIVSDQELTIIHSVLLQYVSEKYGWLFNFEFNNDFSNGNQSNKYMLYILNKALKNTYVDREIRLFKNLVALLTRKVKSNSMNVFATAYFANIWEVTCAKFIGDNKKLHYLVPNPYWVYEGKKTITSQIPDIIININNNIVVLDAKYYRINQGVEKLPGWRDIVKQLFYAISLKESSREVYNAFLFPSSCIQNYEYLGYSSVERKELEFGKVLAFGLDLQMVLKHYVEGNRNSQNKQVIEQLLLEIVNLQDIS